MTTLLHASCIAIGGQAVLIAGPSGAGKSDLALRLVDRGAVLISDDQVVLEVVEGRLEANAPATIAGKIEVRGIGIVAMAHRGPTPVALLIELTRSVERMPEIQTRTLCGVAVPVAMLDPFEASAAIKVELALVSHGLPA